LCFLYVPGVLSVVGVPAFAVVPILLASPDVLVVSCTAVSLSVYVRIVLSAISTSLQFLLWRPYFVNIPDSTDVSTGFGIPAVVLSSPAVLMYVVFCVAVGPDVDVFLVTQ
jgi:hypothetical protein